MLSKLLKYEFRATGRIMLPVYALLLVSCGGCTLFGSLLGRYPESTVLSVVQTVFATLFGVTTFGMLLLTLVLMVYRFYKNLMTDEGYLMFTLPVSRSGPSCWWPWCGASCPQCWRRWRGWRKFPWWAGRTCSP